MREAMVMNAGCWLKLAILWNIVKYFHRINILPRVGNYCNMKENLLLEAGDFFVGNRDDFTIPTVFCFGIGYHRRPNKFKLYSFCLNGGDE